MYIKYNCVPLKKPVNTWLRDVVYVMRTECLRIGSFNIQVFGQKKVENGKVLSYIVQILKRYDLVVILEIRDKKGTAFQKLLQELNQQSNESYASYVSEALGRTVSKEQYGVLYKRTKVTVTSFSVFPDPQDKFERPPLGFIVNVDGGSLRFGWVAVHLDPDSVETELNALYESAEAFRGQNKLESAFVDICVQNVLLAGDMNADCRYLSDRKMKQLSLMKDTSYYWLIDDGYDTTVHSNDCALDRMIVYGNELKSAIKGQKAEAYRYDDEMKLDHKMQPQRYLNFEPATTEHSKRRKTCLWGYQSYSRLGHKQAQEADNNRQTNGDSKSSKDPS
ncbi:deoxyribonuclease-1-like 2 [Clonorchis sinensis]|uniref:Deoxyribonuclease-1-like 2 n=1 Tax=Clonorchis sinensis TaxID=79923 RepID=G7YP34_CLOSI|nr:deoxyribonuclease-1-like 2 [Clonorchis sinensis]